MEFPKDNWREVSPESQGVDSKKLEDALMFLRNSTGSDGISETVIIRNGNMIWKGDNIDKRHCVWSCSKSFASSVLGLLIDDGKCTLQSLAEDYATDLKGVYSGVTLRHFATMTSGYNSIGPYFYGDIDPIEGSRKYLTPGEPIFSPGEKFSYWDNAMRKFGHVLTMIAKEPVDTFFKRRIGDRIGIKNWNWGHAFEMDNFADGLEIKDIAAGFEISARDMARFGHLFLNSGNWDGLQLVSSSWVNQIKTNQVPYSIGHNDYSERQRGLDGRGIYSYNWWLNKLQANGKQFLPGAPEGTFCATGFNDNKCFIIPEWDMVVVRLGTDRNSGHDADFWGVFLTKLGEALY